MRLLLLASVLISFTFWYYCRYFQGRWYEPIDQGATYAQVNDTTLLIQWSRKFQTDMLDSTEYQLDKVKEVRRGYRAGSLPGVEARQRLEVVLATCRHRHKHALAGRIPYCYHEAFRRSLYANQELFLAAAELSDSIEDNDESDLHESIKWSKAAQRELETARRSLHDTQNP